MKLFKLLFAWFPFTSGGGFVIFFTEVFGVCDEKNFVYYAASIGILYSIDLIQLVWEPGDRSVIAGNAITSVLGAIALAFFFKDLQTQMNSQLLALFTVFVGLEAFMSVILGFALYRRDIQLS